MSLGLRRGYVALEPHSIEWETSASIMIETLKNILKNVLVDVQHLYVCGDFQQDIRTHHIHAVIYGTKAY